MDRSPEPHIIPPERFACIVLPDTKFVLGRDGPLYCEECFEVMWPGEKATPVTVTWSDRVESWMSAEYV